MASTMLPTANETSETASQVATTQSVTTSRHNVTSLPATRESTPPTTIGFSSTQTQHQSPSTQNPFPYEGAIIGLSVGLGVVVLLVVSAIVIFVIWKLKRRQDCCHKEEEYSSISEEKKADNARSPSIPTTKAIKSEPPVVPSRPTRPSTTSKELDNQPPSLPPKPKDSQVEKDSNVKRESQVKQINKVKLDSNVNQNRQTHHDSKVDQNSQAKQDIHGEEEPYETISTPKEAIHASNTTFPATKANKSDTHVDLMQSTRPATSTTSIELHDQPSKISPKSQSSSGVNNGPSAKTSKADTVEKRTVESSVTRNEQTEGVDTAALTSDESTRDVLCSSEVYEKLNSTDTVPEQSDANTACAKDIESTAEKKDHTRDETDSIAGAKDIEQTGEKTDSGRKETNVIGDADNGKTDETTIVLKGDSATTSTTCNEVEDKEGNDFAEDKRGYEIYADCKQFGIL